jgi:hypothetical protein
MIRDSAALEEIQQEWAGLVALRVKLDLSAASSLIVGGMFPFALFRLRSLTPRTIFHSFTLSRY